MRISGTYFERLVFSWMPICLIVFVLGLVFKKFSLSGDFFYFIATAVLFWMVDILFVVAFRGLKPLVINGDLYIGKLCVSPSEISAITPVTFKRGKLQCNTIQFNIYQNNQATVVCVMDKPMTFVEYIAGKKSKTLARLFDRFPELETKLQEEVVK